MTSSSNLILQHYIKLTEFLGKALGPDYEVALHDLTRKDRSIIAIANNYISGREVGAPLTNMSLSILRDKRAYGLSSPLLQHQRQRKGSPLQHLFHQGQRQAHRPAVHQL